MFSTSQQMQSTLK